MRSLLTLLLIASCTPNPKDSSKETGEHVDSTPDSGDDTGQDSQSHSDSEPPPDHLLAVVLAPDKSTPYDECEEICFRALVAYDGEPLADALVDIEVDDYGFVGVDLLTSSAGTVETCALGLPAGTLDFAVSVDAGEYVEDRFALAMGQVEVRPFGYMFGYDRSTEEVSALPWTPEFTRYKGNPVLLAADAGEDTAERPMLPTVVSHEGRYYMWYAFNTLIDPYYTLSTASSDDGLSWTLEGQVEGVSEGEDKSWKAFATNSPLLMNQGGEWMLFYTGAAASSSDLSIGLATSSRYEELHSVPGSYRDVADIGDDPVFTWTDEDSDWGGEGVAHPGIVFYEGFYHLWFSTGRHRIGYAMSADGLEWERYCKNPIFEGEADGWEANEVKSAEVVTYDGWFMMDYSAGGESDFQVGWAMSRDGLHWVRSETPVLGPGERGTFEGTSVLGAPLIVDTDAGLLRMWYSGTGGVTGSAIGYAEATLPSVIP